MGILTGIILAAAIAGLIILNLPAFGRLPRGSRLERILQSPNYRDGQFRNLEASPMMTGDKSRLRGLLEFLFRKKEGLRPDAAVPALKTDLRALDRDSNLLVWFGHSSYLLQAERRACARRPRIPGRRTVLLPQQAFQGHRHLPSRRHARRGFARHHA